MNKILSGGHLKGYRTYIISGIGIVSAVGAYLMGDVGLFDMLQTIFPLACIYFLRKGIKEDENTQDTATKK